MFGMDDATLSSLDAETRLKLEPLCVKRAEYFMAQARLQELKADILRNPTQEAEEALNVFSSYTVVPLREAVMEEMKRLLPEALNVEGIKSMAPALLMAFSVR